jgi:hypothetical protein
MSKLASDPAGPSDATDAISEAARLARTLGEGGWLEPRTTEGVPLEAGEATYAELRATGWRYFGLGGVFYERRTVLAGGPFVMAMTALASAVGNHRRRQAAERLAAPQWRPLGPLRVVVTSARLLVRHEQAWSSVWFSGTCDLRLDPPRQALDLFFEGDPPYRLAGPGVPALGVMLLHELFGQAAVAGP